MKLIFLVSDLHLWAGGERVAVMMANHYAARGVETTLLSVDQPGRDFRFEIDPRVNVSYLNIPLASGPNLFRKIESIFAIRKYFRNENKVSVSPDLSSIAPGEKNQAILLAIGNFPSILAAMVPKNGRLSTIGCMHSPYNSIRHIWKLLRWLTYRRLKMLVSLTSRDVEKLVRLNPSVRVIPNPLTFYPAQTANPDSKTILAVGRMDHVKGYDLMLEVFERFCRKNTTWKLKIIGEGPLKAHFEKLSVEKGLASRLIFAPATGHIEKEYLDASIYLMTSRTEGLPMVLLEAQACGLPVVAFDCETGPAEIVHHGADGYLVKPYDIETMCEHLLELAADPRKRMEFGARARENAQRFLPEKIFSQWDELFHQTIKKLSTYE